MTSPLTLQEDMYNVFLASGFQEDIIYTPSGGAAKTIKAIVYRDGAGYTTPSGRTGGESQSKSRNYNMSVHISNDSTNGIATITVREDTVKCKRRHSDTLNSTFLVSGIIQDDEGAWWLGLKS